MKSTADGEGTLLDHSMVIYGAGMGDGNQHSHFDLPVLVAGKALSVPPGRHLVYPRNTPMTNLFLTMMEGMGVETDHFADSTGKLQYL